MHCFAKFTFTSFPLHLNFSFLNSRYSVVRQNDLSFTVKVEKVEQYEKSFDIHSTQIGIPFGFLLESCR